MSWKKGINRLVWVISSLTAFFVLLLGNSRFHITGIIDEPTVEEAIVSFAVALVAFMFVWLLYALSLFVYRGFKEENIAVKKPAPKAPFWQWVTGRFSAENDPYPKKEKKKERR